MIFFVAIVTTELNNSRNKQKAYSNQISCFPHKSSRGNQYLFVLYDFDGCVILAEPLKTRQSKEIAYVFTKSHERLTRHGLKVKIFVLGNELSNKLKKIHTQNRLCI